MTDLLYKRKREKSKNKSSEYKRILALIKEFFSYFIIINLNPVFSKIKK